MSVRLTAAFCVLLSILFGLTFLLWTNADVSSVLEEEVEDVAQVATLTPVAATGSLTLTVSLQDVRYLDIRVAAAGVVTSLNTGDVQSGSQIATIDDAPVIAFQGDAPLIADVGVGDRGPNVNRALRYLQDLGFYSGAIGNVAPSSWSQASRRYNEAVGRPGDGDRLVAAGLVWIGAVGTIPFKPTAAVGDIVGPDSVLGTGPVVSSAAVVQESVNPSPAALGQALVGTVDGVPISYVQGSLGLDPSVVVALAGLGRTEYLVQLQLPQPVESMAVPSGAVIVTGSQLCVLVADRDGKPEGTVAVTVVGEQAGLVLIDPAGAPEMVIANPWVIPGRESCGG